MNERAAATPPAVLSANRAGRGSAPGTRRKKYRFGMRRRAAAGLALGALGALGALAACGRARIREAEETIEPLAVVHELPYAKKRKPGKEAPPWHRALVVELDLVPEDPQALDEALAQRRGEAYQAAKGILDEVQAQVADGRPAKAKWSLLALNLGSKKPRRGGPVRLNAELGLTKLFARRPEIAVENTRLEKAITRLALQAEVRHAQKRTTNPIVNFRRQEISLLQAIDEILEEHHFGRTLAGAWKRLTLDVRDYESRERFVDAAVKSILRAGDAMDRGIPALIVFAKRKKPRAGAKPKGVPPPQAPSGRARTPPPAPPPPPPPEPRRREGSGH